MVISNLQKRSLKGLLLNLFIDFKKVIMIGLAITSSIAVVNFILFIEKFFPSVYETINVRNSGLVLDIGFITAIITFCITIGISTSKDEFQSKFVFPLTRQIYAVGNFIYVVVGSYLFMVMVCGLELIETILYMALDRFSDDFYFINTMTPSSYIIGFILSTSILIFIVSLVYIVTMYIRKYLFPSIITLAVLFGLFLTSEWVQKLLMNGFNGIWRMAFMQQLGVLWGLTILFHIIAYIPLRNMEVAS